MAGKSVNARELARYFPSEGTPATSRWLNVRNGRDWVQCSALGEALQDDAIEELAEEVEELFLLNGATLILIESVKELLNLGILVSNGSSCTSNGAREFIARSELLGLLSVDLAISVQVELFES